MGMALFYPYYYPPFSSLTAKIFVSVQSVQSVVLRFHVVAALPR
jgi:hypothetical protein